MSIIPQHPITHFKTSKRTKKLGCDCNGSEDTQSVRDVVLSARAFGPPVASSSNLDVFGDEENLRYLISFFLVNNVYMNLIAKSKGHDPIAKLLIAMRKAKDKKTERKNVTLLFKKLKNLGIINTESVLDSKMRIIGALVHITLFVPKEKIGTLKTKDYTKQVKKFHNLYKMYRVEPRGMEIRRNTGTNHILNVGYSEVKGRGGGVQRKMNDSQFYHMFFEPAEYVFVFGGLNRVIYPMNFKINHYTLNYSTYGLVSRNRAPDGKKVSEYEAYGIIREFGVFGTKRIVIQSYYKYKGTWFDDANDKVTSRSINRVFIPFAESEVFPTREATLVVFYKRVKMSEE